jgi:hypothetical protein
MAQEDALTLLQSEIDYQIKRYAKSRDFYRRGCLYVTVAMAMLSAITTFLIGAGQYFGGQAWIPVLALATSASVTVVTAWDGYFRHREMWVQKTAVLAQLYELRSRLKFIIAKDASSLKPEVVDEFNERYQAILNGANEAWKTVRTTQLGQAKATP